MTLAALALAESTRRYQGNRTIRAGTRAGPIPWLVRLIAGSVPAWRRYGISGRRVSLVSADHQPRHGVPYIPLNAGRALEGGGSTTDHVVGRQSMDFLLSPLSPAIPLFWGSSPPRASASGSLPPVPAWTFTDSTHNGVRIP